jgi:hypothetical protein
MELFKIGGFCPETNYVFMGKFTSVMLLDLLRIP